MELTEQQKSKLVSDIKAYILGEWKEKTTNKKFAEQFSAEIEKANPDQFIFDDPLEFEKGYVYGNVTAKGTQSSGDTTYTRTINLDLQTPEYIFFSGSKSDSKVEMCKRACKSFSYLKKGLYSVKERIGTNKQKSQIYFVVNEDEALKDYAIEVCEEQLYRLDYELTDCRVNDSEYVQTEPEKICPFYQIHFNTVDKKGNTVSKLLGYYNADSDSMDYNIDVPWSTKAKIGCFLIILGVSVLAVLFEGCMSGSFL